MGANSKPVLLLDGTLNGGLNGGLTRDAPHRPPVPARFPVPKLPGPRFRPVFDATAKKEFVAFRSNGFGNRPPLQ